ncbi:hypothetical protein CHS0354_008556 [Potamilus streckersoni]|uniref:Solute carrier organic anion transporter family member n=1 Tax=Potamilus streckersoni TaxID=2493646 RepID=A0AAE0VHQ3_9BIVA|nr:hypothetical protein CHS0354_008556 [Potamilus streckersoni]
MGKRLTNNGVENHMVNSKDSKSYKGGNKLDKDESYANAAYITSTEAVYVGVYQSTPVVDIKSTDAKAKNGEKESNLDTRYGYGSCKPSCCQIFNKIGFFVLWAFLLCFVEGFAVNGVGNAGLPSIEKQFKLTSSKSALIPSSQDIGALVVVLFVSFIGSHYNKASWVASGSLIMAVGSFIFIIPHMAKKYQYSDSVDAGQSGECKINATNGGGGGSPPCGGEGEEYLAAFSIAQIIHGIGFTPMFTLGTVYIDENGEHTKAAVYIGLTYAAAAIGVACGFFAGGQMVQKLFVEFERVPSVDFDARDPRWVGAWWLGFVPTCIAFALLAVPLFGFPKYLPGNKKAATTNGGSSEGETNASIWSLMKTVVVSFFKAVLRLIVNPIFMLLTIGGAVNALIIFGVSAFAFKYLAEQYNMPFDEAGLLLGGLILVGSFGMFLGGLLIRLFRLEMVGMTRLAAIASFLAAVMGIAYLAGCPNVKLAGLEVPYHGEGSISGYKAMCQGSCNCTEQMFNLVCGNDRIVYYSPCHAGCTKAPATPTSPYQNCQCVASSLNITIDDQRSTAVSGRCDDGCTKLRILAPFLFLMMLAVLTSTTPVSIATLRCVDDDIQPMALGMQWMILRLLGSIPGPVLIGTVIDKACLIWRGGSCGSQGFCMLYSHDELSIGVLLWWVITMTIGCLLFSGAAIFAMRNRGSFDTKS